ncbi:hypothetical protein H4219_002408 [Mycoemilia scoparia]|uniref:Uncharacterized protein n=1 Tax=Mycoemilia scoparia TaxID=417184 RepID=A0A9W7ZXP5_9FUNG|nr:hypothetical protein H4219_002408 [Mycoemilia scoparia]
MPKPSLSTLHDKPGFKPRSPSRTRHSLNYKSNLQKWNKQQKPDIELDLGDDIDEELLVKAMADVEDLKVTDSNDLPLASHEGWVRADPKTSSLSEINNKSKNNPVQIPAAAKASMLSPQSPAPASTESRADTPIVSRHKMAKSATVDVSVPPPTPNFELETQTKSTPNTKRSQPSNITPPNTASSMPKAPNPNTQKEHTDEIFPGISRKATRDVLQMILDIDEPKIQPKMVNFLLLDGAMATFLDFVTYVEEPLDADNSQTPSTSQKNSVITKNDRPNSSISELIYGNTKDSSASGHISSMPEDQLRDSLFPHMLSEMQRKSRQHQRRLKNRSRGSDLPQEQLKRSYNVLTMLTAGSQCSQQLVDSKIVTIIYCLMDIFDWKASGSFYHFSLLLNYCINRSPLRVCRMLLWPPSDTNAVPPPPKSLNVHSKAYNSGMPLICDMFPYLSEPPIQQAFIAVVFTAWSGRLLQSIGLNLGDDIATGDSLTRMGLADTVLDAMRHTGRTNASAREAGLNIIHSRFYHLHDSQFLRSITELMEDDDPETVRSSGEFFVRLISDYSPYSGISALFQKFVDGDYIVRQMAQNIVDSSQAGSGMGPKAEVAINVLNTLLRKTSCQYGRLTRMIQNVRDPVLGEDGSEQLLEAGLAARSELETFVPGLLAQLVGLQGCTDLTSNATYRRMTFIPTAIEEESGGDPQDKIPGMTDLFDYKNSPLDSYRVLSARANDSKETSASSSLSSSLSPSSTLSATSRAIDLDNALRLQSGPDFNASIDNEESTPGPQQDIPLSLSLGLHPEANKKEWSFLSLLPKLTVTRLRLLEIVYNVLIEAGDPDEIIGWVDVRVWAGLVTWYFHHPNNNALHSLVYKLISLLVRWSSWWHRDVKSRTSSVSLSGDETCSPGNTSQESDNGSDLEDLSVHIPIQARKVRPCSRKPSASLRKKGVQKPLSINQSKNGSRCDSNSPMQQPIPGDILDLGSPSIAVTQHLDYIRSSVSNCDRVLAYLVEKLYFVERLIATLKSSGPNSGFRGFSILILNTLRLGVQLEESLHQKNSENPSAQATPTYPSGRTQLKTPMTPSKQSECEDKGTFSTRPNVNGGAGLKPRSQSVSHHSINTLGDPPPLLSREGKPGVPRRIRGHSRHNSLVNKDEFEKLVFLKSKSKSTESLSSMADGEDQFQGVISDSNNNDGGLSITKLTQRLENLKVNSPDYQPDSPNDQFNSSAKSPSGCDNDKGDKYKVLHRWQHILVKIPEWQDFLPQLRSLTATQIKSLLPFSLVDQSKRLISNCTQRPFPNLTPLSVKVPENLDNKTIRTRRIQQQFIALIGEASGSLVAEMASALPNRNKHNGLCKLDEDGIDLNSVYAFALGFGLENAEANSGKSLSKDSALSDSRSRKSSNTPRKTVNRHGSSRKKISTLGRKRSRYAGTNVVSSKHSQTQKSNHPGNQTYPRDVVNKPSRKAVSSPGSKADLATESKLSSSNSPPMPSSPKSEKHVKSPDYKKESPNISVRALAQKWESKTSDQTSTASPPSSFTGSSHSPKATSYSPDSSAMTMPQYNIRAATVRQPESTSSGRPRRNTNPNQQETWP